MAAQKQSDYVQTLVEFQYFEKKKLAYTSDESKPSWHEPELELKDFQLGSAWLLTFFPSAESAKNKPKFSFFLLFM